MERLYYDDAYLTNFAACVTEVRHAETGCMVTLDRSAFYPTSGGQPGDLGEIEGIQVIAVEEDSGGTVWHHLDGLIRPGQATACINWPRRFDLMQQHTGQHLLSEAFVQVMGAETVGFHLTEDKLQIDLDRLPGVPHIRAAEELANRIVWENREVACRFIGPEERSAVPWRKPPTHEGPLRLVAIAGFDYSPCGGTHVHATGEVGLIKIVAAGRAHDGARISFLCGGRALKDYGEKHDVIEALVNELHVPSGEILAALVRERARHQETDRRLTETRAAVLAYEADKLQAEGSPVVAACPGRNLAELRQLAARLTSMGSTVALAAMEGDEAWIVAARPSGAGPDLAELLRRVLSSVGGKGGGTPAFAQGGCTAGRVNDALAALRQCFGSRVD